MRIFTPILIYLFGCGPGVFCESGDAFPGMWSGWVNVQENLLEMDTNLHLQLFQDAEDKISGWFYHTEGTYIVQDEYVTPECSPYQVEGDIENEVGGGFHVKCLHVVESDGPCIEVEGAEGHVTLTVDVFPFGSFEGHLGHYEEIGDRNQDSFLCLRALESS